MCYCNDFVLPVTESEFHNNCNFVRSTTSLDDQSCADIYGEFDPLKVTVKDL